MAENEFTLDVSADISAASSAEEISINTPSELINPIGDVDLPQSTSFQYNQDFGANQQTTLQFNPTVDVEPSIPLQFNQPDLPTENIQNQFQSTVELPESQIFTPTEDKIQPQTQVQKTTIADGSKVDPRDILDKTNRLSTDLENLTKDVESMSQSLRYPDPRTESRDNFDQRITIDSNNLIFFNRLARVTEYPNWS